MRTEIVELLGALLQGRRLPAGIGEGVQHEPVDPLGPHHRKRGGAQRARGFAHEMHARLTGLADHQFGRGDKVFDAAGDIRIAGGSRRAPVILVIHRPHVKTKPDKYVHRRVFAGAGNRQVERRQCRIRRAVDEEENRAGLPSRGGARVLAVEGERNLAFVGGIIGA